MGGALHRATRVFRMYNIDNRVEKTLSRDKPVPAPRHKLDPTPEQIENNIAPELIHQKNEKLLDYLHDVKVYSTGDNPVIRRANEEKQVFAKAPLLNRLEEPLDENSADGAFGYVEPQRIPPGRVSLRQFLAYLQQHRDSPDEYTMDRFSEMYTIKPELVQRLFKYHTLLALQEVKRSQSQAPDRPLHVAAVETLQIEIEARQKPGHETGFTSKY